MADKAAQQRAAEIAAQKAREAEAARRRNAAIDAAQKNAQNRKK